MSEVIADQNYYYDAEGKVTTDESKGERWLAREGANVLPEHREALETFQGKKVARQEATTDDSTDDEKSAAKPANKKASPSKNKGAK